MCAAFRLPDHFPLAFGCGEPLQIDHMMLTIAFVYGGSAPRDRGYGDGRECYMTERKSYCDAASVLLNAA